MIASVELTLDGPHYSDRHGEFILCYDKFEELMNEELPDKIIVTASTRLIANSARVSVKLERDDIDELWGYWYTWEGRVEVLIDGACALLSVHLKLPLNEWRNVWVAWKKAKP